MVSVAIASKTTAMLSLSSRISFRGENHTVGLPFHHEQVMVHAVLVQVPIALGMLPRSEHVDAVDLGHGHNRTFVNDDPVNVLSGRLEPAGEIMLGVEPRHIPNLHQADAVQAGYPGFDGRTLILDVNDPLKLIGALQA